MKNYEKIIVLSLISFLFFGKIQAQIPFQIQGVVIDTQTSEPLSAVSIIEVENPEIGEITNNDGFFQINVTKLPTTLQFSFVGYETQTLKIENPEKREFVIRLNPVSAPLPEITVSSKRKIDTVFTKPYSVVDYIFFNEKILLLAHRNSIKKYTLIAIDEKTQEEIAEYTLEDFRPKGLFQHCTGEAFLVTEANVYKIAVDSMGISFPKRIFLGDFYLIEQPCVLANKNFLYFARYFYQGQALRYIAFAHDLDPLQKSGEAPLPIDSLEKYEFPLIQNEDNIVRLIEELGLRLPWSGDIWEKNLDDRLLALKESGYKLEGIMKIFYPKLNAPIFQKENELLIFNHFSSELQFFSEKRGYNKEYSY